MSTPYPVLELGAGDIEEIADVIATAFTGLAISRWLVPDDPLERWQCLRHQFELQLDYAFTLGARAQGIRDSLDRLLAVAVWVPPPHPDAPAGPEDYEQALLGITGEHHQRFRVLDAVFAAHTPFDPHIHLMFLASVRRGRGLGGALLRTYLTEHDRRAGPLPVCLDASGPAVIPLYRRHGFTGDAPVEIPGSGGLCLYPMRRDPLPPHAAPARDRAPRPTSRSRRRMARIRQSLFQLVDWGFDTGSMQEVSADRLELMGRVHHLEHQVLQLHRDTDARDATITAVTERLVAQLDGGHPRPILRDLTGGIAADAALGHLVQTVRDHAANTAAVLTGIAQQWHQSAQTLQALAERMLDHHDDGGELHEGCSTLMRAAAHLARRAQSVAVLGGAQLEQQWSGALSVPLALAVRTAARRITAGHRVTVSGTPPVTVDSEVIDALIHVLAELLDNAAHASPPDSPVEAAFTPVHHGWAVTITDQGRGLDEHHLSRARERASGRATPAFGDLGQPPQIGLAAVGTLARRHRFRVDLAPMVHGGMQATVIIPDDHLSTAVPADATTAADSPPRPATTTAATTAAEPAGPGPAAGSSPTATP